MDLDFVVMDGSTRVAYPETTGQYGVRHAVPLGTMCQK
jgi:hypothetical protein